MKKILLSVVLASSFAMAGDLAKCSEAFEKQVKYEDAYTFHLSKAQDDEYHDALFKMYRHFTGLWREKAKEDCKGVLQGKPYNYVTTGNF